MFQLRKSAFVLIPLLIAAGCSESVGDPEKYSVNEACKVDTRPIQPPPPAQTVTTAAISSMQQLWDGLGIDNGSTIATRVAGDIPAPDGITQGFTFFQEIIVSDKSELPVPIISTTVPAGKHIGAIFFQIEGIDEYAVVPISSSNTNFVVRGPIPPEDQPDLELITQAFTDAYAAAGQNLIVRALLVNDGETVDVNAASFSTSPSDWMAPSSEIESTATPPVIKPQKLGTGTFQITLVWDQANDIDLWLTEPDNHIIKYSDPYSSSNTNHTEEGRNLDRDDTDGFGAENIYFTSSIPEGNYTVAVNYFAGTPVTNYVVIVRACGQTRSFTGSLAAVGEVDNLLTFNYSTESCSLTPVTSPSTPDFIEETTLCDIPSKNYPVASEGN